MFFALLIALCLVGQAFFAMMEMAVVSFNKVRLQYYVSQGDLRARWINALLRHPATLFGTTLIGVNLSLIIGSECARRFYEALGLSPQWAPVSLVFLVLLFAEVAPLFAGRRHPEHVALLGAPLLYLCSLVLRPVTKTVHFLCRFVERLFGRPVAPGVYLSREELQKTLESSEEGKLNTVVAKIFGLKSKQVRELMHPLSEVAVASIFCTVGEARTLIQARGALFLPLYQRNAQHIVSIAYPRDLLRISDTQRIKDLARAPWFITEQSSIFDILKQFRRNAQSVSVVLNERGVATGVLTLDAIVDALFSRQDKAEEARRERIILDKSLPADMSLQEFHQQFGLSLTYQDAETLEEVMTLALGHLPVKEESVRVGNLELTAQEASLLGVQQILVRTLDGG
jgi:CBS domain containing-hemolysin-like protein